ncbi:MAG: hypothetical protein A2W85_05375 [Bacteroidetes bacterium GWF2_41_31]|nr:MAG: hypothetical protein A2W85_05375 [Bacteroidetes bacterium GWF2_41_31]
MIEINETILQKGRFTESGIKRFKNTVIEYSFLLFEKSKKFGEARKDNDSDVEINYENVQAAARTIAASFGIPQPQKWKIWAQAGEYLLTALCGYLGSQATQVNAPSYYTLLFVISAVLGVGLFITRRTSKN